MAVAALVSVTMQGYLFGVGNNIFHVPFVLRWADDPVFADDQFIQSLKNFTSMVWLGVRYVSNEENIEPVFYVLHLLTRAATLLALVWAASELGVRGLVPGILLGFWFGILPGMRWDTPIGSGGIFGFSFTHTDVAIALTIASIALAARRMYFVSFAILGLTADVNAFAAVWAGCALVGVVVGDQDIRKAAARSIGGVVLAAVLSLPVALWIYETMASHPVSGLERDRFLREYFASHSLIESASTDQLLLFGGVALSGLVGFRLLSPRGNAWFRALAALCVLVIAGMLLPMMITSRFVLDLHLLRASGLIQLLGLLGLTVAAISSMSCSSPSRRIGGALALCFLALPALQGMLLAAAVLLPAKHDEWKLRVVLSGGLIAIAVLTREMWGTPILCMVEVGIAAAFMVFGRQSDRWPVPSSNVLLAAVAALLAYVGYYTYQLHKAALQSPVIEDARDVANWARNSTPVDALFLVPQAQSAGSTLVFASLARRRVWVDWKRGGAAMWMPSYYAEWSRRMAEVNSLADLSAKLAYACKNHINYVLIGPETGMSAPGVGVKPVYRNAHFQVFDAIRRCANTP